MTGAGAPKSLNTDIGALTVWFRRAAFGASLIFLVAVFAPLAAHTGADVVRLARVAWQNAGPIGAALRQPDTGREILSPHVNGALGLLATHDVKTYRLTEGARGDEYLRQRIEEAGWPRAYDANAIHVLALETETPSCERLATAAGVALDRCE